MKNLITIFFLLSVFFAVGQEEKKYNKTISVSELEGMLKNKKKVRLKDTYIKLDMKVEFGEQYKGGRRITGRDAKYYELIYNNDGSIRGWKRLGIDGLEFNFFSCWDCKLDEVFFTNCKGQIDFYNCIIEGDVQIKDSELKNLVLSGGIVKEEILISGNIIDEYFNFLNINISNSSFANTCYLSIDNNQIGKGFGCSGKYSGIKISNTLFNDEVIFSGEIQKMDVNYSTFRNEISLENLYIKENISLLQDTFIVDSNYYFKQVGEWWEDKSVFDYGEKYPSIFTMTESKVKDITFKQNYFQYNEELDSITYKIYNYSLLGSDIEALTISNEIIERANFNNSSISNLMSIDSTVIRKSFSVKGTTFPEYNLDYTWMLLKDKMTFFINDSTHFIAQDQEELANEKLYNDYITSYKKFFSVFKNKGDLKSANACYAEMKDVETRRLKYLYETEGGVDHYLSYQLNVFLKFFAEYGTSPIKSVKISGWVILIFASFYFFFYSDWDQINRKFLMDRGNKLMSYFKSEQKLEELYSDKHKEDISTFTEFKENLKESKTQVPFFFMLFLKPLYWVAVVKHKFNKSLYKRVEILQGKWVDLTAGKKVFLGTLTFLTILTYGFYLIAIRSLNSLILSINTFTTLGFGDIPVVGISRYVAILEGFLGWFLLSIFSVSLISQILQN